MLKELDPKGRRSKGGSTYIRRQKEAARKSGIDYVAPLMPITRTPEQRTEWDEVIEPKIRELPNFPEITKHIPAIKDFWQMRRSVAFEEKDAVEASFEFNKRHPELDDHVYNQLKPAFDIIIGRFKQVTSAMGSRRK